MKKLILTLLVATCASACAFALAACVNPDNFSAHSWSETWSRNETSHWRVCEDEGCSGRTDVGEHEWELTTTFEGQEPTCINTGRGLYTCKQCKATAERNIPATGDHHYVLQEAASTPATCNTDGLDIYICDNAGCGQPKTEVVPATGEHDFSGAWLSDGENGHYHVCNDCGTESAVEPHEEILASETSWSGNVSDNSIVDGKKEYRCKDCNYLLRTEYETNPYAPVNLEVSFSGVTSTPYGNDINVTLVVGTTYSLSFTATDAYGNKVACNGAYMANMAGIRAYCLDDSTGEEYELDLSHASTFYYISLSLTIRPQVKGPHSVAFRFETGQGANLKVRAQKIVHVDAVAPSSTTAASVSTAVTAIDGELVLASAQYFDKKAIVA